LIGTARGALSILDGGAVDAIEEYVLSRRVRSGGFRGRSGDPDVYYSMFALWSLAALRRDVADVAGVATIGAGGEDELDLAHLAAVIETEALVAGPGCRGWRDRSRWAGLIETFRRPHGGYAPERTASEGSLGGTYLAVLAHERLREPVPGRDDVVRFVLSKRTGDGFSEVCGSDHPTVVSTAAAVAVLRSLAPGCAPDPGWLWTCYCAGEGGFKAFSAAPEADLLSTAVALFVLRDAGAAPSGVRNAVLRFVQGLWRDDGGFSAGRSDTATDCEYTFYALLAMGAVASLPCVRRAVV
jgi:geranylgeranyl transferase type-2 subunit beta